MILAAIVTAFVAGGVAWSRSYWPFAGHYQVLDSLTDRASRLERRFDQFTKTNLLTGLHELIVRAYPLPFPDSHAQGPFVALSDNEFLVATRLGELHHVAIDDETLRSTLIGSLGVMQQIPNPGGVKDLLLTAPNTLLASFTTYDQTRNCYALGLFEYSLDVQHKRLEQSRRLFESQPCLPLPLSLEEQAGRTNYTVFDDASVQDKNVVTTPGMSFRCSPLCQASELAISYAIPLRARSSIAGKGTCSSGRCGRRRCSDSPISRGE